MPRLRDSSPGTGEECRALRDGFTERRAARGAFDERAPGERVFEPPHPAIEVPIKLLRDDVAESRVGKYGSPQAPVIRLMPTAPAGNVDSDFAGDPSALERRVDALTGQRVGEPAGVARHVHRASRRS